VVAANRLAGPGDMLRIVKWRRRRVRRERMARRRLIITADEPEVAPAGTGATGSRACPPGVIMPSKKRSDGYAHYMRVRIAATAERDSDAIRVARSKAWLAATREGGSLVDAIAAANAAELEVRRRLGMDEFIDTTKLATDGPYVFPSDARCIEHIPKDHDERELDT